MLQAARTSLFAGTPSAAAQDFQRYDEAIAAYQVVLRRDPENIAVLVHFGLIVGKNA